LPQKIEEFTKNKIKKIESEGDISFAITEVGEVFMWPIRHAKSGENILIPKLVPLPEKISSIACGGGFVLLLSINGLVFSMGKSNTYGQLGHGDTKPRMKPTLIELFAAHNERIAQISCGFKHCIAKSYKNKAYSWGLVFLFFIFSNFIFFNFTCHCIIQKKSLIFFMIFIFILFKLSLFFNNYKGCKWSIRTM